MLFLEIVSCCRLLRLTTDFYSQMKRIIRSMISLPVQRYNSLIKILDKPPSGGRVVTTLFQQLKYIPSIIFKLILMIYGSFASLYNVPSTLVCLNTSRKTLISAKSLIFHRYIRTITSSLNKHSSLALEMCGLIDSAAYTE